MKISHACVACHSTRLRSRPAVLMPFLAARIFGWQPTTITPEWGLRDIDAGQAYSLCATLMCDECGMIFLDMRFDADEMDALHRDYRGAQYTELRNRFEPGYAALNAMLREGGDYTAQVEAFIRPHLTCDRPRVLDWGGDTGANTPFRAEAVRHDVYDISQRSLVEGATAVTEDEIRPGAYDLVVLANVLEHVSHPTATLRLVTSAMDQDTLLYIELPYEDLIRQHHSNDERLALKRHWHEHINFFTPDSLDHLLRNTGLQTVSRTTKAVTVAGRERHVFLIAARLA